MRCVNLQGTTKYTVKTFTQKNWIFLIVQGKQNGESHDKNYKLLLA